MSRRRREDDYSIPESERERALRLGRPTLADHPSVADREPSRARRHRSFFASHGAKVGRKAANQ
jgi:hypothetical protein